MCFCSGRIRTLVAMATYSSHRLIMGKVEIDSFFLPQQGYLDFLQKCLLRCPLDLIRNHMVDEADALHTCE